MDFDYQSIFDYYHLGEIKTVAKLSGGLINPAFLVNDKYVLRLESQTYESNPGKFKKEAILLSILPEYCIPTPKVVIFDDSLTLVNYPYLLLEYIRGEDIAQAWTGLSIRQQIKIAYELGRIAKKIHSLTPQNLDNRPLLGNLNSWLIRSNSNFEKYWKAVKDTGQLSGQVKQEIDQTQKHFKSLDISQRESLIHGDFFTAGNIQLRGNQIVGIFDFEYSQYADPLWDLQKIPLAFQLTPKFSIRAFLNGYGVTEFTDEEKIRLRMYCFHQGVWEIWAVITQFMPFGAKELAEGKQLISNTIEYKLLS